MTIKHHLNAQLLTAYAAGNLPEAFSLVVATHVSMCLDCRIELEALEAVGGVVLQESASAELSSDALQTALNRIGKRASADVTIKVKGSVPGPLNAYVGGDFGAVRWQKMGLGLRQSVLATSKNASARLLYIPAGRGVPDHGHRGTELTLVLQGAFRDESDHFAAGDLEIAGADQKHSPVAEMGQDCICLAATDAPLRFKGLVPRLLQPVFRI